MMKECVDEKKGSATTGRAMMEREESHRGGEGNEHTQIEVERRIT